MLLSSVRHWFGNSCWFRSLHLPCLPTSCPSLITVLALSPPLPTDQQQQQPQQQQQQQEPEEGKPKQETVVLPQVDARGRAVPGAFGREEAGAGLPGLGGALLLCYLLVLHWTRAGMWVLHLCYCCACAATTGLP